MKSLKDILPWEERPEGCKDVMWRYSKNPIIDRYHIPTSKRQAIFVTLLTVYLVADITMTVACLGIKAQRDAG